MAADGDPPVRMVFLLTYLSSYLSACLAELASDGSTKVLVICRTPSSEAPLDPGRLRSDGVEVRYHPSIPGRRACLAEVRRFSPDVVFTSGWQVGSYRHVVRRLAGSSLRVVVMDNRWLGTAKQRIGVAVAPVYIRPYFDIAFLPGRDQEVFARKLGFGEARIWRGVYCCDHPLFAGPDGADPQPPPKAFVMVGRLVADKGIATLAEAYRLYRARAVDPWPLLVCGAGPLAGELEGREGVEMTGFVQPPDLPALYGRAGCLVLPSLFEPWGVAIHEATAAGLSVICSSVCGAAPHLVEDGVNGYLTEPGNAEDLAAAMARYTGLTDEERARMSATSRALSLRYTPERWAAILRRRAAEALQARASGARR